MIFLIAVAQKRRDYFLTGGGLPSYDIEMTQLDERIVGIIGNPVVEGNPGGGFEFGGNNTEETEIDWDEEIAAIAEPKSGTEIHHEVLPVSRHVELNNQHKVHHNTDIKVNDITTVVASIFRDACVQTEADMLDNKTYRKKPYVNGKQ